MHDLDQLLRADADTWRTEVDATRPAATTPHARAGSRPRTRGSWHAPLAAAIAVLILAAGATYITGGRHAHNSNARVTAGATADPLTPASPDIIAMALKGLTPVRLTNRSTGGIVVSMHWQFLALLDGGRTILVMYLVGDPCDKALGFRVTQTSSAVEITTLTEVGPGCEQSLVGQWAAIHLDRPLGSRELLHAPTSPPH